MLLSKSDYIMFLKHPAWLWLKKHDKDKLPEHDANLLKIFEEGNIFEGYAEQLFPKGIKIGFNEDDWDTYKTMPQRTQEVLSGGSKTIFQGRFEADKLTCIVDILDRVEGNTFDLYEVKSSTKVKPEHEHDMAFQKVVLERSGLSIRNLFILHINNEYKRDGKIKPKKLSKITDITNKVLSKREETLSNINKAIGVVSMKTIPNISPRHIKFGAFSKWLDIFKSLSPDLDKYSIYNLIASGVKRIGKLEDAGIKIISEIPLDFGLTPKQRLQVITTKSNRRIIDRGKITGFFKELKYPLYFLDYETFGGAIPSFDGMRPYRQLPFQYSLHILKKSNGGLKHKGYLHREGDNPEENLLKQLKKDINSQGSIIVWNEGFEKGCNNELSVIFPKYEPFLSSLNKRIIDLMIPFSKGWYADKDFFGSASLKLVLPILVPKFKYGDLNISDGKTSQRIWIETFLEGKNDTKKEQIVQDLLDYCELDTLAMVEILKILENEVSRIITP